MSGKKPRIGRPPIPKKFHKASLLSVRFSADERRIIDRAAKDEGLSAWARRVLLTEAGASSSPALLPEHAPESSSAPQ
jgi:hypothetical protein